MFILGAGVIASRSDRRCQALDYLCDGRRDRGENRSISRAICCDVFPGAAIHHRVQVFCVPEHNRLRLADLAQRLERGAASIFRLRTKLFLNADELVVFGDPVGARERACLDLPAICGHGQIGNR